jgi:hypothetical protein
LKLTRKILASHTVHPNLPSHVHLCIQTLEKFNLT